MTEGSIREQRARLRATQEQPERLPWRPLGRVLVCTGCRCSVDVIEAATGARTDEEHRWIDPDEFVCGSCLDLEPMLDETPSQASEAMGRARTAQERAKHKGGSV